MFWACEYRLCRGLEHWYVETLLNGDSDARANLEIIITFENLIAVHRIGSYRHSYRRSYTSKARRVRLRGESYSCHGLTESQSSQEEEFQGPAA